MSNTTPESPEDRSADEPEPTPPVPNDSENWSAAPVAEPDEAGDEDRVASLQDGRRATSSGQATSSAIEPDDDLDDEPGIAAAAPVASSSHISGTSDTDQTRAYDSAATTPSTDEAAPSPSNEYPPSSDYQPATDRQPVTPGYAAQPMYVTAPERPKPKGNRGAGILIALLAAVVYAIVSAIVVLVIFVITKRTTDVAMHDFVQYVGTASYYIPIIFFALAFIVLIAIVNRGGWWAYILGAFFVGVVVYFAYVGGVLLTIQAWNFSPGEVARILSQLWANPLTIGAAIVAREVPIWFGLWIAARGRKVRERNDDAQRDYEKALADGPQPIQRAA